MYHSNASPLWITLYCSVKMSERGFQHRVRKWGRERNERSRRKVTILAQRPFFLPLILRGYFLHKMGAPLHNRLPLSSAPKCRPTPEIRNRKSGACRSKCAYHPIMQFSPWIALSAQVFSVFLIAQQSRFSSCCKALKQPYPPPPHPPRLVATATMVSSWSAFYFTVKAEE